MSLEVNQNGIGRNREIRRSEKKERYSSKSGVSLFGDLINSETEKTGSSADTKAGRAADQGIRDQYIRSASALNSSATENVFRMSADERTELVSRMKEEQENRQHEFLTMIRKSLGYQASEYQNANATPSVDNNGIWHFLASGNYTVDAATRTKAQENISENGYYGVKETSKRIFTFAAALAGDDQEKMKRLQAAVEDGYRQAGKAWGQKLPEICKETLNAVNQLFEDYYRDSSDKKVSGAQDHTDDSTGMTDTSGAVKNG